MIGFDGIIRILLGDVARGGYQLLDHSWVGRCPVGGHLGRAWAVIEGANKEPAGGRQVPLLRDQHVDDLAALVDRPIQIHPPPPPGDLHIRLLDEPTINGGGRALPCEVVTPPFVPSHVR
jgi:hypothetical protein